MKKQMIPPEQAAAAVLDVLIRQDGELISASDLATRTGLTLANTSKGIAHLRDELASIKGVMFVARTGKGGGVALTKDADRADSYARLRARMAQTQLRRVQTGTIDQMVAAAVGPQVALAQNIQVSVSRLIEDLARFQDLPAV